MGWCGGTYIFDVVVESLLKDEIDKEEIIVNLINALTDLDWDCECESNYWDTPFIRECFIKFNEKYIEYFEEEEI